MTVFPRAEPSKVLVKGVEHKQKMPASKPAEFEVDTKRAGQADIEVKVKNPKGKVIPARLGDTINGTHLVSFTPDEIGTYTVNLKYGGKEVEGSPFKVEAIQSGEAKKCKMAVEVPKIQPSGSANQFTVDAREAGDGAVTCKITSKTSGT